MRVIRHGRSFLLLSACFVLSALGGRVEAAPIETQITPVAVYHDAFRPFGMAYDPVNNVMWFTQGDTGDGLVHSARPFNSFSAAELAGVPLVGGVYQFGTAAWEKDAAGAFATGTSAYFRSLAYDSSIGKLVMQGNGFSLVSFDAGTGANLAAYGAASDGFSDGLDVDGGTVWYSPDVQGIQKNGVVLVDYDWSGNPALGITLPSWTGLGSAQTLGFSGVEQVAGKLWAVAVQDFGDAGQTRTIVSFDPVTGELLTYDENGDPIAARWEDMAFDGRYLYAADLRGNADGDGIVGDIYVFDIVGAGGSELAPIPEPGTFALAGLVLAAGLWRRRALRRGRR